MKNRTCRQCGLPWDEEALFSSFVKFRRDLLRDRLSSWLKHGDWQLAEYEFSAWKEFEQKVQAVEKEDDANAFCTLQLYRAIWKVDQNRDTECEGAWVDDLDWLDVALDPKKHFIDLYFIAENIGLQLPRLSDLGKERIEAARLELKGEESEEESLLRMPEVPNAVL